jgi:hypothetical protein
MAQGDRIIFPPEIRATLENSNTDDGVTSRTIAAWMTRQLAQDHGGRILIEADQPGALTLGSSLKPT